MDLILYFVDIFLHLDKYLGDVIEKYDQWTFLILFCVLYCETGLVVTPFLPGDSLLFTAGTFAGLGRLDLAALMVVLGLAPIMGDSTNYWIGRYIGPKILHKENVRFLNKEYLHRAHEFYEKYGGKTIAIARFMPIIRTFAPFVAGIGSMNYLKFLAFSIGGTILWVSSFVLGGYFFGNMPIVKKNFTLVIMAIVVISVIPSVIEFLRQRRLAKAKKA
jgi:membrane-associated protein